MKWLVAGIFAFVALEIFLNLIGYEAPERPPIDRGAEIKVGCEREFVGDPDAIQECRWRLMIREEELIRAEKLERAAR